MLYELRVQSVANRVASVIQQFVAGMDSCALFWQMVKRCWKQFLPVFTNAGNKLTRNSFQDLFTIGWSPAGSNRREEEEATIFQWEWWLMAIQEQEVDHTFEELLVFITGADLLPPLGFPQSCNIDFYDQESGMRRIPYTSMCSLSLYLPRGVADEDQFKDLMNDALKASLGFGKV
ncbi:G2/M phase-specific E3 ubiquitin-protein ligase-like [Simochromis diagramma]|uniref:G2/M phase-specific E3 ubiquitin-protein ligase-like n=1 Tax=Simochromis diagramma TaxID=43689 RepID=UPI001A7E9DC6|nr:G2/M phase-specific E3 ubiquitin-protein ligase-like [Simochromis diagramma]